MKTSLSDQSQKTLVQIIDLFYNLHREITAAEKESGLPIEAVGLAPGFIEPIASALDVMLRRHQTMADQDPLMTVGKKVHKTFMLSVGFAKDPYADAIQYRVEALWIGAAVLTELYWNERNDGSIIARTRTADTHLEAAFFGHDLVNHMQVVHNSPCEELAETLVVTQPPSTSH